MNYGGEEKRKFPRALFPCKIVIGSPIRLLVSHTENVSEGGLRVILEEKLSAYTNVGLELFFEKNKPVKCKGRIIWVVEKVNPLEREAVMYDTGIQFTEISDVDRDHIKKLVSNLTGGGAIRDDSGES